MSIMIAGSNKNNIIIKKEQKDIFYAIDLFVFVIIVFLSLIVPTIIGGLHFFAYSPLFNTRGNDQSHITCTCSSIKLCVYTHHIYSKK